MTGKVEWRAPDSCITYKFSSRYHVTSIKQCSCYHTRFLRIESKSTPLISSMLPVSSTDYVRDAINRGRLQGTKDELLGKYFTNQSNRDPG